MGRTVTLTPPDNRKPPSRADRPGGSGRSAAKIALIAASAVLAAFVGFFCWAVAGYSNIYPGVTAWEVKLGGMTVEQAAAALEEKLSRVYDGASVTITADGKTTVITAADAGAGLSAARVAQSAQELGRTGNVFRRVGFVLSAPFVSREADVQEDFYIDREAVAARIKALAALVDKAPVPYSYEIGSSEIAVRGGSAGCALNQAALTDLVVSRFTSRDFSEIATETVEVPPEPLPLQALYDSVNREPKDAYLDTSDPKDPKIMPHQDGLSFDLDAARAQADAGGDFTIPLLVTAPALTQVSLESRLFKDQLSRFTTNLSSSSSDRTGNIRLAASFIDGTILLPGDVFSYNGTVGERTAARGFKGAGAYVNGRLVDEIGGGICQMSSTLYNTALLANLKIVERQNHSMTVAYLPSGRDATVNWGSIDFRFENDTDYPVQILARVEGKQVVTEILGYKADDHTVEIERDLLSTTPFEVVTTVNESLAPGTQKVVMDGHTGAVVQTYRVVKDGSGNVVSRKLEAKSTYRKVNKEIEKGPDTAPTGGVVSPSPNPSVSPSPGVSPSPQPTTPTPSQSPAAPSQPPDQPSPTPPPAQPSDAPGASPTPEPPEDGGEH